MVFIVAGSLMPLGTPAEDWLAGLIVRWLPENNDFLHVVGCGVLALLWCRVLKAWSLGAVPSGSRSPYLQPLLTAGYQVQGTFGGGGGARLLGALGPHAVWATLVPDTALVR